jgi:hypothetical protein
MISVSIQIQGAQIFVDAQNNPADVTKARRAETNKRRWKSARDQTRISTLATNFSEASRSRKAPKDNTGSDVVRSVGRQEGNIYCFHAFFSCAY